MHDEQFKFHKVLQQHYLGEVENVLHDFVANLFRKLHIKFHHNRPNFVGDIMKNILVSFFRTHCRAR